MFIGTMDPKQMWNYVKSPPKASTACLGVRVLLPKQLLLVNIKYTDTNFGLICISVISKLLLLGIPIAQIAIGALQ